MQMKDGITNHTFLLFVHVYSCECWLNVQMECFCLLVGNFHNIYVQLQTIIVVLHKVLVVFFTIKSSATDNFIAL